MYDFMLVPNRDDKIKLIREDSYHILRVAAERGDLDAIKSAFQYLSEE